MKKDGQLAYKTNIKNINTNTITPKGGMEKENNVSRHLGDKNVETEEYEVKATGAADVSGTDEGAKESKRNPILIKYDQESDESGYESESLTERDFSVEDCAKEADKKEHKIAPRGKLEAMFKDESAKNYYITTKGRVYRRKSNVGDKSRAIYQSKGKKNMHAKNKQLNYLRYIWTKCHRMRGVDKKLKSKQACKTATHESLQYNECQICKSVIKFNNHKPKHMVLSHELLNL